MTTALQPKGTTFVRRAIALAAGGDIRDAHDYAIKRWGHQSGVAHVLRAAVAGGSTDTWGAELADTRTVAAEFLEVVRPMTILGKLQGLRRVPVNVPFVAQSDGAVAYWRSEGKSTPVSSGAFDRETMVPLSIAALIVLSNELVNAESPEAEELIRRDLARAAAQLSDQTFIDPANAGIAGQMPAAITNGAISLSSVGSLADDMEAAIGSFSGSLETASWVMHPRLAASIGLRAGGRGVAADLGARGGTLAGLPAIVSESCAIDSDGAGSITLIDAAGVCVVDEGAELMRSKQGTVEMSDAPTGDTLTPTASSQTLVSLFQTESTGIIVSRRINWKRARTGSVVVISNAVYTGS